MCDGGGCSCVRSFRSFSMQHRGQACRQPFETWGMCRVVMRVIYRTLHTDGRVVLCACSDDDGVRSSTRQHGQEFSVSDGRILVLCSTQYAGGVRAGGRRRFVFLTAECHSRSDGLFSRTQCSYIILFLVHRI